eukprot:1767392-Prorocentrum_lima.AAC.1
MSVDLDALRSEQDAVDDAQRTSPPQAAQQSQSVDPNVLGRQEGNLSKRRPRRNTTPNELLHAQD